MSIYISLKLSELTPTTLAAIISNLADNFESCSSFYVASQGNDNFGIRQQINDAFIELVDNAGFDDAINFLRVAKVDFSRIVSLALLVNEAGHDGMLKILQKQNA